MKTLTAIFVFATLFFATSCEGPLGPPGMDGLDGDSLIGSIFEIQGDFTQDNDHTIYYEFPPNFTIYETDVVLVYILWDQTNDNLDVWRLLPQTLVLNEGILQYNFDYTLNDVQIFLDGNIPFDQLLPSETDDQIFRIAVLPADFTLEKSAKINDLNSILKSPNIKWDVHKSLKKEVLEK